MLGLTLQRCKQLHMLIELSIGCAGAARRRVRDVADGRQRLRADEGLRLTPAWDSAL
jgi:hypothetical protein